MEKNVKKPQYIRRRKEKGKGTEKYYQIIALGHVRGYYLHRLRVQLWPFNAKIQDLGPRFRLAFSPTLYKFIVWATWAQIHSCSGFKSNPVLISLNSIRMWREPRSLLPSIMSCYIKFFFTKKNRENNTYYHIPF